MSMLYSSKLVERYRELKAAAPGCLLLMQVGFFMQVQAEDARAFALVTGLKLRLAIEVAHMSKATNSKGVLS